jgi:pectate lyase
MKYKIVFSFLKYKIILSMLSIAISSTALAQNIYISPKGSDSNSGDILSPLRTIMAAQDKASTGDTVYIRGGTYYMTDDDISCHQSIRAIVNNLDKDGISYINFPRESPVFDFSQVKPEDYRVTAFMVRADHCVFKGFDVVGVQVTIANEHTQSEAFMVNKGNYNRFENLAIHDGMAIGWYLVDGSNNYVLNVDAYNNQGLNQYSNGNVDGFGAHPRSASSSGNVISGSRAWFNSDDGFDLIFANAAVTIENSWAFYNGYDQEFNGIGDGNGFKAGGYGSNGSSVPASIPRHIIRNNLSVYNRSAGFYANHQVGGQTWINNTAIGNQGANFNMLSTLSDNDTDVDGYDHYMRNNLGFDGYHEVINLGDENSNDIYNNYFNLPIYVTAEDFRSLDERQLMASRKSNGDLPDISYGHLKQGSDLIDAGVDIGHEYNGACPDLGAFESDY